MTDLTRLFGCALLAAIPIYACGDDGSDASQGAAGQGGEGARAGEPGGDAAGSNGGGADNTGSGGDAPEPMAGSGGDAPEAMAGSSAGGADPVSGEGGAGGGAGGASTCELGEAASAATNQALDLFGTIVYFDDGAELPAGRYRVSYLDGCMKYASNQDWTIHAYADGQSAAWWLVGASSADRIVVPPGTIGWNSGNGAHTTFDACVTANLALPPVEFDFVGGKLGVWLLDSNYGDNLAGEANRNPKWKLTLLGDCVE